MRTALAFCRSVPSRLPWVLRSAQTGFSLKSEGRADGAGGTKPASAQPSAVQLSGGKSLVLLTFPCVRQGCKSSHQWGTGDREPHRLWARAAALPNLPNHICSRCNFGLLELFVYSDSFCLQTHFSWPLYFKTISVSLHFLRAWAMQHWGEDLSSSASAFFTNNINAWQSLPAAALRTVWMYSIQSILVQKHLPGAHQAKSYFLSVYSHSAEMNEPCNEREDCALKGSLSLSCIRYCCVVSPSVLHPVSKIPLPKHT